MSLLLLPRVTLYDSEFSVAQGLKQEKLSHFYKNLKVILKAYSVLYISILVTRAVAVP